MDTWDTLLSNLSKTVLKSPQIIKAFRSVDRADFVPEDMKAEAYIDTALPIGEGQTISQPYTVAFMLELLEPKAGEKIMDIGSGSGWTTALLSSIVGNNGKVYAFERIKKLSKFGEKNMSKYPELKKRAKFFPLDASLGVPGAKPVGIDAVLASAELEDVSQAWRDALCEGGRLVYPKENSIFKEVKIGGGKFHIEKYPGFVFVPFIRDATIKK